MLTAGVTVVAEAAFQDRLWRPGRAPLAGLAAIRVVRCTVDPAVARARVARRVEENARRAAHDEDLLRALADGKASRDAFVPISLATPTIQVDTTDGYDPNIPDILAFISHKHED